MLRERERKRKQKENVRARVRVCVCVCARVKLCENSTHVDERLGAIGVRCLTCVFSPIVATTATGVGKWEDGMLRGGLQRVRARARARDLRVTVLALFRGCYMLLLKRAGCLHLKLPVSVHCDLLFFCTALSEIVIQISPKSGEQISPKSFVFFYLETRGGQRD